MNQRRINITDLAREAGEPRDKVLKWLNTAGLERGADKTFPYHEAKLIIDHHKSEQHEVTRELHGLNEQTKSQFDEQRARDLRELSQAKRDLAQEQARRLKIQNDTAASRLISREEIDATVRSVILETRAALLAIPMNIAPKIAGERDALTIAQTLDAEIKRALHQLADSGVAEDAIYN